MNALLFDKTKKASLRLSSLSDIARNAVLLRLADAIVAEADTLLAANAKDLQNREPSDPLYDRLQLTKERLEGIAADMRKVVSLPDPLGRVLVDRVLPNGLQLRKVSVPFGVIGVIYESRPNVTFDVFSLCFKSGNACLLKGGRDAQQSNLAAVALIKRVLESMEVDTDVVNLLPATHEAAQALLSAVGYVDLVIPRGGKKTDSICARQCPDSVHRDGCGRGEYLFRCGGRPGQRDPDRDQCQDAPRERLQCPGLPHRACFPARRPACAGWGDGGKGKFVCRFSCV